MILEQTDERYSFRGKTEKVIRALRQRGFEVDQWEGNYDIRKNRQAGHVGRIIAFCEPRFRRLIVYDVPSNPELRRFAKTYLG